MDEMAWMVGAIAAVFLGLVAFVFWLGSLAHDKRTTPPPGGDER